MEVGGRCIDAGARRLSMRMPDVLGAGGWGGGLRAVCRSRRTDFLPPIQVVVCVGGRSGLGEGGAVLAAVKDEPRWRAVACGDP